MNENWLMVIIGPLLVFFGFATTNVKGAMPGSTVGPPPTLTFRLIMICFGVLMFALGLVRLIRS